MHDPSSIALMSSDGHDHALGTLPAPQISGTSLLCGLDHPDRGTTDLASPVGFIEQHRREFSRLLVLEARHGSRSDASWQQRIECSDLARRVRNDALCLGRSCECCLLRERRKRMCKLTPLYSPQ